MSLEKRLTSAVDRAFNALDDLVGPMTVTTEVSSVYSTTTGNVTKVPVSYTVQAVFDMYDTDRIDGTIVQRADRKILVKPIDSYMPKVGDTITDGENVTYNIMDIEFVKAYGKPFLWEIQARK